MWSKIVFTGLLVSSLPINLIINGQVQRTKELKLLKIEVDREIAAIKKVVKRLKIAKIAIPSIIAGAGLAVTAAAAAVVAILFISRISKLKKAIKILNVKGLTEKVKDKLKELLPGDALSKKLWSLIRIGGELPGEKEVVIIMLDQELKKFTIVSPILAVAAVLIGFVGTTTISIGTFFGLSASSVAAAFRAAQKLREFDKKNPGVLTEKDRRFLFDLEKFSNDIITKAIVKNLRLKDALATAVNMAVRRHPHLVAALRGPKKARKIFITYIKLKWKETLFEKALREGGNFIKSAIVKLQLKSTKKKLKKLEKRYTQLEAALKNAVQTYQTQANGILQELQKDLIKAAEKKELKPEMRLQPVSPIPVVPL